MSASAPSVARARLVPRRRLTERLAGATSAQLITIVAPAGYGKTTLLCDWDAEDARPFAWVTLDAEHNDPGCLETSLGVALQGIEPDGAVLVVDDLQWLRAPAAQAALAALVANRPPGITVAVASRAAPALPVARLRAEDRIVELGPAELALDLNATAQLLRLAGLDLDAAECVELWSRTEGWPAAVALGALVIGDPAELAAFGGDDHVVADYLRDEVLRDLPADDRQLLLESAILDTLSGPLCDHVLERAGSAAALSEIARERLLFVRLDRSDERFRHHRLMADMLAAELRHGDPARAADLHRRASEWFGRAGDDDRAIRHALRAGELEPAAELVSRATPAAVSHGRKADVEAWLSLVSDRELAATPVLAVAEASVQLASGQGHLAEHWAWAAAGAAPTHPGVSLVRATLARGGLAEMSADAERAYAREPEASPWRASFCLLDGTAALLTGRPDDAAGRLLQGAHRAAVTAPDIHAACLTQLAVGALAREDWEEAAEHITRARAQVTRNSLGDYPTAALVFAVSAIVRAHRGRVEAAQTDFHAARRLRGRLTDFAAWYMVELDVVLARAAVRLSELVAARELLASATRTIRLVPDADMLAAWLEDSWAQLDLVLGPEAAPPASLTTAELRTLRFLPTHLSFREIAERTYVSANTVKTQANAVYRKFDVSCRSDAVARARRLGLLDA